MPLLNGRPRRPGRRGVTLVEMLVVVALVILMMVILVQIFQSATGAMTASRTSTELDLTLRQIDGIIRSDLAGVTAKMTPPNDPKDKSGYLEYAENAPSDAHGEDTDDTIAFTTKAPEGQFFTGRQMLAGASQPILISSQVAEIIYFWRNGNLYRRVLLVVPERKNSMAHGSATLAGGYPTAMFGIDPSTGTYPNVSWQGLNDISARPSYFSATGVPIPNDLGDLTNRENRIFSPRFNADFQSVTASGADGIADDFNADGLPDYYPTLYYDGTKGYTTDASGNTVGWKPNSNIHESQVYPSTQRVAQATAASHDVYAFPFIFPEAYSVAELKLTAKSLGSMHSLYPNGLINHSPLAVGDNLPLPTANQTWWGRPTWRETMAGFKSFTNPGWSDPFNSVAGTGTYQQPPGLQTLAAVSLPNSLPPLFDLGTNNYSAFTDQTTVGATNFVAMQGAPTRVWEDDLVLTGVRSFDIKAYDINGGSYNVPDANNTFVTSPYSGPFSAGYQDLGYAANPYVANQGYFLGGPKGVGAGLPQDPTKWFVNWQPYGGEPIGFGHEGRIPPLPSDFRYHPRRGTLVADTGSGVNRLNRTFDTWSTDYTNAPDTDLFLTNYGYGNFPVYPSFPPPYPSALRGIQIQIRIVDPRNERSKVLTIRHDFTDKLED